MSRNQYDGVIFRNGSDDLSRSRKREGRYRLIVGTNMTESYFGMVPTTCHSHLSESGDTDSRSAYERKRIKENRR